MALLLVGISHNTAPVSLREKVAFPPQALGDALQQLRARPQVEEAVIVSTCNRTELYLALGTTAHAKKTGSASSKAEADSADSVADDIIRWLADYHGIEHDPANPTPALHASSYRQHGQEVVRHLMGVACGLDSMVLGEPQILGQIKSAYAVAKDKGAVGSHLNRVFQFAFAIAKRVRTDTAIGENPVSVAYAAVTLAGRIFSNLQQLRVLLVGAGQTVESAATHLMARGVRHITVANRTLDNALELSARLSGNARGHRPQMESVLLSDIPTRLKDTDIVVSSTNSQLPLLGKGAVEAALKSRRHRPMLLIDLAVPRDIEPEVSELADAYLYSVDDIGGVIEDGVKSRTEAAAQARHIIQQGVTDYVKQGRALDAVDTVTALRRQADAVRLKELARARKALQQGEEPQQVLEALARSITRKLLHDPSVRLKQAGAEGRNDMLQLADELYDLHEQTAEPTQQPKPQS